MFERRKIKRLSEANERLRSMLSKLILENKRLKNQIKAYELSEQLREAMGEPEFVEIYGSEMYQRNLIGSEYTRKWCEGQIQKEISRYIMEEFGKDIVYSNQIVDDKHAMMTGKMTIAVRGGENHE